MKSKQNAKRSPKQYKNYHAKIFLMQWLLRYADAALVTFNDYSITIYLPLKRLENGTNPKPVDVMKEVEALW
jgi:hypothetical protein